MEREASAAALRSLIEAGLVYENEDRALYLTPLGEQSTRDLAEAVRNYENHALHGLQEVDVRKVREILSEIIRQEL
jgi:hypothetical protein